MTLQSQGYCELREPGRRTRTREVRHKTVPKRAQGPGASVCRATALSAELRDGEPGGSTQGSREELQAHPGALGLE